MRRLAMIGVGNMGEALVRGLVRAAVLAPSAIAVTDARTDVAARLAAELGVTAAPTLDAALADADVVVLAVKPQSMSALLAALRAHIAPGAVVVSVAAGVTVAALEAGLPDRAEAEVVRTMPNTPALVGLGASAYALGSRRTGRGEAAARAILEAVGLAVEVPEAAMDAVTALSGSGPAYVFKMLEAMHDAGVRVGLAPDVAFALARKTLHGAATLALGDVPPTELRRRVTSPGGTTEAALKVLDARGWAATLGDAIAAARARGAELGRAAASAAVAGDSPTTPYVTRPEAGALARARAALARGESPVAVLDVDLTLIENAPRTRAVLGGWLDALAAQGHGGAAVGDVSDMGDIPAARAVLQMRPLVFSIRDNLAALASALGRPDDPRLLASGLEHWKRGFFDPANLAHDVALPGAVDAVRRLVAEGVTVVYLTARPHALAAGTVASFAALGLPVAEPGTVLMTKPDPREGDEAFKLRALASCARLGTIVLTAENEPSHANAMSRAYPDALHALVLTRHSPNAPEPLPALVRVPHLIDAL